MKLILEGYPYPSGALDDVLKGFELLENQAGQVALDYVGYCFSQEIRDCVFFLPKVLLDEKDRVLGKYRPETLIDADSDQIAKEDKDFLYRFSLWIYRAVKEFRRLNPESSVTYEKSFSRLDSSKRSVSNTLLDIVLSLLRFHQENRNWVMFTLRNMHSGHGKINWHRTITKQQPIFQNGSPIYLNPTVRRKQINYDEELFVIFFSILRYIKVEYGFSVGMDANYDLITGKEFTHWLKHYGTVRLQKIKHRYFSDRARLLWQLCHDFFALSESIHSAQQNTDYLMVKDFNIVFEAMIDELLSDKQVPAGLKEQADGKIVDHIYPYESLVSPEDIYYIGDSKYYKIGHQVKGGSRYKQYTYARNVIQYNLDLLLDTSSGTSALRYRDELTEGYNITPNFFISAKLDDTLDYRADNLIHRKDEDRMSHHFQNRLFDRDTLLLSHYDINFLFVLALYAGANDLKKAAFKENVRQKFRKEILQMLVGHYDFYTLKVEERADFTARVVQNFKLLNGKIFCPDTGRQEAILALEKGSQDAKADILRQGFIIEPRPILKSVS